MNPELIKKDGDVGELGVAVNQSAPYSGPNTASLIDVMGTAIAKSQLLGCQNIDQGKVLAMTCIAKGVDPLTLAQRFHIIQGQLSMRADAMLAEFHRLGGHHRIVQRDSDAAVVTLVYRDEDETFSLSWVDAQAEPWTKSRDGKTKANYSTPRIRMQMLWARVLSDGIRAMCPEVCCGVYAPEELGDVSTVETPVDADDAGTIDTHFATVALDDACDTDQVARIRELLREVAETEGNSEIAQRMKHKLATHGLEKLSDLSRSDASQLIEALQARNVDSFFKQSLAVSAKND